MLSMDQEAVGQALNLSGAHTVRNARETHALLLSALEGGRPVLLDCTGVTEADVSFVQLLLSARRTAAAKGLSVTIAAPAESVLPGVLARGGFTGPGADAAEREFWLKAEARDEDSSERR